MPIRLNLLAEAKAEEELRRRDPVKRAVWGAILIVSAMLGWSCFLYVRTTLAHARLASVENQLSQRMNQYQIVVDDQNKVTEMERKLTSLRRLSTDRLLYGTLLNALQQTTLDDVQLLRFKVDQTYIIKEGTKSRTNEDQTIIPGKPSTATENIVLTLEGSDSSQNPGDQVDKFKLALAANPYFKTQLLKTNAVTLKSLSAPQALPGNAKASVIFKLECRYPVVTR